LDFSRKSSVALILTGIYLVLAAAAFAVMFLAEPEDSLAGIFVVLVAMPWTLLLSWVVDAFGIDSLAFNTIFSALSCLLNAGIIYAITTFVSARLRR
jgi:hypothetical protein